MKRGWLFFLSLFLLVTYSGCQQDDSTSGADAPTILSFNPTQVTRGEQNVTGTITGSNFNGIVAVSLGDGITIHQTTIVSSTEIQIVFSVNQDAPAGNKTIRISTPGGISSNSELLSVSDNHSPNAVFSVDALQGTKSTVFHFNASGSSDSDGQIASYSWDFGDGNTAGGIEVSHQYNSAGTFTVRLTVTDNHQGQGTSEKSLQVQDLKLPIARFFVTPHGGTRDTLFQFDASNSFDSDGRIVTYRWDFKDGGSDTGKTSRHKFSRVDTFQVVLTVTDDDGLEATMEREVQVRGKWPVASFTFTPGVGDTSTVFQFDAGSSHDSDGRVVEYSWRFGDGATAVGEHVSHKYESQGNRTVSLRVVDDDGLVDYVEKTVSVGSGGGGAAEGECTVPAPNRGFIYGTVIGVEGNWAIVRLPAGSTCANSFYKCGDMRRANPEQFRGIIKRMINKGNGVFWIYNDCPYRWPPAIGEVDFLYYKTCDKNFCP